ncbi:MAG: hypothetical protein ACRYFU_08480 [Janthinobacterium lividum]
MKRSMLQPVLPFLALPLFTVAAFGQMTGVSHPDVTDDSTVPAQSEHYVKPSDAGSFGANAPTSVPQATYAPPSSGYASSYAATGPAPSASAADSSAPTPALIVRQPIATNPNACPEPTRPEVQNASIRRESMGAVENDSGVVTGVPYVPHQINAGTVLHVRLDQEISTETTPVGTHFTAQLIREVSRSGEVLLPAGTIIQGRLTKSHGGKRISGAASLRLQPEAIAFPDGTSYPLHATVSGLENYSDAHVNDEGTIIAKTHPEIDAAALGLTTTAGTVTGAVVGGGVGAAVGAGVGAGLGTYMWLNRDHQEMLPAGVTLLLSLDEPLQLNPR